MAKKINSMKGIFTIAFLTVLMVGLVSSYGISSPVWKGNPLLIFPGDTKTVSLYLQNQDEVDERVDIKLKQGSGIASVREGEYLVPAKTKTTEVVVTIAVPEDAPIGTSYEVTVSSAEIASGTGEGVQLSIAMETTFDVLVAEVPKTPEEIEKDEAINTLAWIIGALIVAALIIAAIYFFRKKKK